MSRYTLKQTADGIFQITLGRAKVGFARRLPDGENAGKFVARIGDDMVIRATASAAFHEIVAVKNRIALCGLNDSRKAADELDRRNAEVDRRAAEINAAAGFRVVRVRNSRVSI